VRFENVTGWLPIHFGIEFGNLDAVRVLADADPNTLQIRRCVGLLPLHYAALPSNMKTDDIKWLDMINFLLRRWPEAISGAASRVPQPDPQP